MEIAIGILVVVVLLFGAVTFFGAPFVPTRRKWAEAAIEMAGLTSRDLVVDLGSGSGVVLELAAQRGAQVVGYEINPILALWSKIRLMKFGVRANVKMKNFWITDLPAETTVIYVFAVARDEQKLIEYIENQTKKLKNNSIKVISFGLALRSKKPVASVGAANLYIF